MRKIKYKIPGLFVALPHSHLDRQECKELSTNAFWVFIQLKRKWKGKGTTNELSLTYREVKYKMSSATYRKAIKELISKGFIEVVRQGGLHQSCNLYGICYKWQ